ncbi:MAG: DUF421 domain-containing protein [Ruminococcaceae bacterium]|nr:DUF421 domain-containing protein [Oscillospiraceae bacterium]
MAITFIRTLIIFVTISIAMRLMGKRQLGELEPSELVVAVLVSDITSHPLENNGNPLLYGLIPIFTLLCCEILISGFAVKSIKFRKFMYGTPNTIIEKGVIDQAEMKKNRFTVDELMEELRKKGYMDISTVKHAILETDGSLSIIPYASESPVTPRQMELKIQDTEYPVVIISDGRILENNLRVIGRDKNWLKKQLSLRGMKDASKVYIMASDREDNIYIAQKENAK